jgi:phage baseplate assembly protein W|tara:strand:- start:2539 stop:2961 length:423 start_codon:yes stop_codon:yes gene_type:complete
MSALETDLNPNTYIGLSFPIRRDRFNDFAMTKTSLQQAKHNLKNLLLTFPGERVGQPEFGSRLRALCFEQIDDELPVKLEEEVKQAVSIWLPYINIQEVNTLTEEQDQNKIHVEIKFSTTLNPQTQEAITVDASYTAERV